MSKKNTPKLGLIIWSVTLAITFGSFDRSAAQAQSDHEESILKLMEDIFNQFSDDMLEIDPDIGRIAVYRLQVEDGHISPALRQHFESRFVEMLGSLKTPTVVSLPELNTLKISSNDSSFSIMNSLPSPEELWRVGRKLRVDAFLEGNLVYLPDKALLLDVRLNRTGTNQVLWAKSYRAQEKNIGLPSKNPLRTSVSGGIEVFQVDVASQSGPLLHPDFGNKLTHYSVYFNLIQYLTPTSRLRYEVSGGVALLASGMRLAGTAFTNDSFYSSNGGSGQFSKVSSYNVRTSLISTVAEHKDNPAGDWLSVYLSITRYFTLSMPDLTGIGFGLRTDINPHFSVSGGFSMIFGPEFDSQAVESTGETLRLQISGPQYQLLLLQYTF
jgi:hypothetical protein